MKLWIDDVRPAPANKGWHVCKSVNEAKRYIEVIEELFGVNGREIWFPSIGEIRRFGAIDLIDIDHDAGEYAVDGGDYIRLLDWLEETGRNYPIRIHSMNPVGVENMRRVIQRNGWTEVR